MKKALSVIMSFVMAAGLLAGCGGANKTGKTDAPSEAQSSQMREKKKEKTSDAKIEYLGNNVYKVIIHQGYNRQIRRMFKVLGKKVISLKRIKIGKISLSDLKEKEYRYFDSEELKFVEEIRR